MTDRERIKQLHKQAFDWVQYQLQTVGSYHSVMQSELLEMVNEKFAELIVQECVSARLAQPELVATGVIKTLVGISDDGVEIWKDEPFYTVKDKNYD